MNFHTKLSFVILLVSCAVALCNGQEDQICTRHEELTPVHNFSTEKILGTWIAWKFFAGLKQDATPVGYRCLESNITWNDDETPFTIAITETYRNLTGDGEPESATSNVIISDDVPAIWRAVGGDRETNTVYVQTDYSNWALQFGCTVLDNYRYEFLMVWTRTRDPDPKVIELLDMLAQNYGFPLENVMLVDQSDC